MAEISSINFKKSKPNNLAHNERITPPSYLIGSETLQNEVNRNMSEALALKQSMINKAIETYNKNKKPKAPPFKATSYEWSAVVNLKPSSTMQDLEKLAEYLQEKYGFQCYQIAIHRDEGHFENGEKIFNHHAHLEFITLDRDTGRNKFNRRDIKFQTLRDIQTETAEILGMQRGVDKRLSGAKRIEPRVWATLKEKEKGEKQLKVEFLNEKVATKKQLDELFEARRKEMIAEGDNKKEQYDELRKLKEFCENKKFTLDEAQKAIQFLRETQKIRKENAKLKEIVQEQRETIKKLNEKIKELDEKLAEKAKEASKTAENQKNNENLYSTENVREIIAFKSEIDTQANIINKEIDKFSVLLDNAKPKKLKEIDTNTNSLYAKISNNQHLQDFFSFDKYTKTLKRAISWLKENGLNLQNTR